MLNIDFENFLQAINDNNLNELERLLVEGYDPDLVFKKNGLSPIHLAALFDRPLIIKLLSEHGATIDLEEKSTKKTALHIAAYYGHLECCKVLMDENPSINSLDAAFFMPLHYAVLQGHLKIVQLLSENVKDLWKNSICGTPIDVAIRHKKIEIIDYFLKNLTKYFSSIYKKSEGFPIFNYFKKIAIPIFPANPIYYATLIGSEDIVRSLLANQLLLEIGILGSREDISGLTPLHLAAEKGYSEIVRLLLSKLNYDKEEDMYFSSPIELALENGHKGTVDVFIEKGAKPWLIDKTRVRGRRPNSTVLGAVWDGDYQKLKEILENEGAEVLFEKDKIYGDPPLQFAILRREVEIAKLFIEYGGKELILQKSDSQMTALHRAAFHGVLELYQHIFHIVSTDVLKQPCETWGTPLDCALYENHIELVEWTLRQPKLGLSFEELFLNERNNWALMDLNPSIGGYFTEIEKSLV